MYSFHACVFSLNHTYTHTHTHFVITLYFSYSHILNYFIRVTKQKNTYADREVVVFKNRKANIKFNMGSKNRRLWHQIIGRMRQKQRQRMRDDDCKLNLSADKLIAFSKQNSCWHTLSNSLSITSYVSLIRNEYRNLVSKTTKKIQSHVQEKNYDSD